MHALAFPARFTSGRPTRAVTQPFFVAYAVRMSFAVHVCARSRAFSSACVCMPARHVRLYSAGGSSTDGCVSPSTASSGSSCAAWWMESGIAETRAMGRIPARTYGVPYVSLCWLKISAMGQYLCLHMNVVGEDEPWAVHEPDFGCPE